MLFIITIIIIIFTTTELQGLFRTWHGLAGGPTDFVGNNLFKLFGYSQIPNFYPRAHSLQSGVVSDHDQFGYIGRSCPSRVLVVVTVITRRRSVLTV